MASRAGWRRREPQKLRIGDHRAPCSSDLTPTRQLPLGARECLKAVEQGYLSWSRRELEHWPEMTRAITSGRQVRANSASILSDSAIYGPHARPAGERLFRLNLRASSQLIWPARRRSASGPTSRPIKCLSRAKNENSYRHQRQLT